MRCGEIKEYHWFPAVSPIHLYWCNRCIATPSGVMPIKQTEEHRRK
ncbi:MAG: hypothetical protein ACRC91_19325 [Aeromonas sp.]